MVKMALRKYLLLGRNNYPLQLRTSTRTSRRHEWCWVVQDDNLSEKCFQNDHEGNGDLQALVRG